MTAIDFMIKKFARLRAAWECPRCRNMHRRAQEAESREAKAIRQCDMTRLWRTVDKLRHRSNRHLDKLVFRNRLYRAEIEKIRASGLVDTVHPGSTLQTSHLSVLVDRLIHAASEKRSTDR